MIRILVYTAVFGPDVDHLRQSEITAPGIDYRCYTDQPDLKVDGWDMMPRPLVGEPAWQARRLKILAHDIAPDFDVWIWLDSAFRLRIHPWTLLHGEFRIRALKHPHRNTITEEGREIVKRGLVPQTLIDRQLGSMPNHFLAQQRELTSTGLLVRVNKPAVREFNDLWWHELRQAGHTRDQMTVDYAAWCVKIRIEYLQGHYRDNPYADWKAGRRRVA